MSTQPVAHGGIEAKMGAKKTEMKKQIPATQAASPVFAPSEIPAPDSTNAVTGVQPSSEPIEMQRASTMYATVEPSKSPVTSSVSPAKRAMPYSVPVQSRIST